VRSESCPKCGNYLKDITVTDDLPQELMDLYQAGQWGVYECPECGWNDVVEK